MVVNVGHDHLTVTTNISYLERKIVNQTGENIYNLSLTDPMLILIIQIYVTYYKYNHIIVAYVGHPVWGNIQ